MSQDGEPDFVFQVFDYVSSDLELGFQDRLKELRESMINKVWMRVGTLQKVDIVPHYLVGSAEELMAKEAEFVNQGFEGLMLRKPVGKYKCGRSTLKEELLLKVKRFEDSEATVLDVLELMHNSNEKETDELGMSKRSKAQAGMIPAGMLGKFKVKDIKSGVEFEIGTGLGLTQELRKDIWDNKGEYLGKLVKYKFQPAGVKDLPRFPVWLGFRHEDDL
jgi:DNA ligase-1